MILYPAVDILAGKAVRLVRGDFERRRDYFDDPLEAARRWVDEGARHLHVVDLDGATGGEPANLDHVRRIADELGPALELLQCGGGLRSAASVEAALGAGADRVVIGTAAFSTSGLLETLLTKHTERIAVGVDVRDGYVAVQGWRERTSKRAAEAIEELVQAGVSTLVYTSVDRDGTLEGLDPSSIADVSQAAGDARFVYSGGIGSLDDLRTLTSLALGNLDGVIVGKALYEGRFTVADAQRLLGGQPAPVGDGDA